MADEITEVTEEKTDDRPVYDQLGPATSKEFDEAFEKLTAEPEASEEVIEEEVEETAEAEISDDVVEDTETEEATEVEEVEVEQEEEPAPVKAEQPAQEEEVEVDELKLDLDEVTTDPDVRAALEKITAKLNDQEKSIVKREMALKIEREKAYENRIDSCFDNFAGDLPSLGNTSKLSEDNGMYRRRLFQHAQVEAQISGIPIEEAIKETVSMFKNKDGEKVTEKKLITKLQKQKSKFTNAPTRKNKSIKDRKFATEGERQRAVMNKAFADAGIE
jgi:hypothetical protein